MLNSTVSSTVRRAELAVAALAVGAVLLPNGHPQARAATVPSTATTSTSLMRGTTARLPERVAPGRAVRLEKVRRAYRIALRQRGDPYRYGAEGPSSFDCSGLTSYAYHHAGFRLPRTSSAQAGAVRHIQRSRLRLGDLVFFTSGGHVYHVGLFAGHRRPGYYLLHAPYPGKVVQVDRIWTSSWFGGTLR
ncbi:C40 family peptidase [Nocardioides sp. CER19]|uniref:C40 family peptidase n=1 Tax=Nocardioides sp. CER19 TaxID=3038538 RepID=UPI00244CAFD9|nr:C40 family peptidase [Nocardioides sp. CER19]MDH2414439.1 C40 family peptidase [Nocardioides sp. CER19]